MSKDTLMLVAFGLFVLLLGMRMKQRYVEWKSEKDGSGNVPGTFPERKEGNKRRRVLFVIQLFVLGGLLVYMTPILVRDFIGPDQVAPVNLFLRCLIFIFTIYVFVFGCRKAFRQKDKGNTGL